MKHHGMASLTVAALLALSGTTALAQDRGQRDDQNRQEHTRFDEHDQQVAHDWYNQHRDHAPVGLRSQDRLSPDEESRLREGAPLDRDLRRRVHPAPQDLTRQLPPPPRNHRYVAVGGHVALIDNRNQVKAVIHLHDEH